MLFRKAFLGICVLMIAAESTLEAQSSTLFTDGKVRVKGSDLRNTRITVMPQFGDAFDVPLSSDQFDLDLGLFSTYLLRAAHPGCASKEIVFDLWVPDAYRNSVFHFPFEILLEAFQANERTYSYEEPIGAVFFDEAKADFTYTTDYGSIKKARSLPTLAQRMKTHISLHPEPINELAAYEAFFAQDPNAQDMESQTASNPAALPTAPDTNLSPVATTIAWPATASTVAPATSHRPLLPSISIPIEDAPISAAPPLPTVPRLKERTATSSRISTRLEVPSPVEAQGSHELNVLPNMVIVIDRFGNGTSTTEVRKVTHAYGAVFYFQDGTPITERSYLEQLAEFARPNR